MHTAGVTTDGGREREGDALRSSSTPKPKAPCTGDQGCASDVKEDAAKGHGVL